MEIKKQLKNLSTASGVYLFRDPKQQILYIGKAVNLRNRVRSHFNNPKLWINQVAKIETRPTNSEIAALILESQLIKKHRPPYNVQWKDDKNYFYVAITQEEWPRVYITHQPQTIDGLQQTANSKRTSRKQSAVSREQFIGPFVDGNALKSTLRVLRKIFPFRSCKTMPQHPCLQYYLERCVAPCKIKNQISNIKNTKEYLHNITAIIKILNGESPTLVSRFKKEMRVASTELNFEQAGKIRDQITGLEKVLAHSQIIKPLLNKNILRTKNYQLKTDWHGRVEAYDISNISGELAVGSMIVFENGQPKKSDYRRFKIRTVRGANDIAMIKEVLQRRFKHPEWPWPDIILIDGGLAQLNAAIEIIQHAPTLPLPLNAEGGKLKTKNYQLKTRVFSLAKKQEKLYNNKNHSPIPLAKLKPEVGFLIQRIRNEAHRFALNYHRQLRKKQLL